MSVMRAVDAILPGKLYLGNVEAASSQRLLKSLGVTHVVNAARELPNFFPESLIYQNCNLNDDLTQRIDFDAPLQFIHHALSQDGVVLVHCRAGISRSASIVIGYLMMAQRVSMAEALVKVRKARPCAYPNPNFQKQLRRLQEVLTMARCAHSSGLCSRVSASKLRYCASHLCLACLGQKSAEETLCARCRGALDRVNSLSLPKPVPAQLIAAGRR